MGNESSQIFLSQHPILDCTDENFLQICSKVVSNLKMHLVMNMALYSSEFLLLGCPVPMTKLTHILITKLSLHLIYIYIRISSHLCFGLCAVLLWAYFGFATKENTAFAASNACCRATISRSAGCSGS